MVAIKSVAHQNCYLHSGEIGGLDDRVFLQP